MVSEGQRRLSAEEIRTRGLIDLSLYTHQQLAMVNDHATRTTSTRLTPAASRFGRAFTAM